MHVLATKAFTCGFNPKPLYAAVVLWREESAVYKEVWWLPASHPPQLAHTHTHTPTPEAFAQRVLHFPIVYKGRREYYITPALLLLLGGVITRAFLSHARI